MKSHVDRVLRAAEARTERIAAYLRLAAVVYLALVLYLIDAPHPQAGTVLFGTLALYGVATLAALALSHIGYFRAWLPYVFTTLDMAMVLGLVAAIVGMLDLPLAQALRAPGAALVYMFLAHAAMRYRPGLVVYAGVIYVAGWSLLYWQFSGVGGDAVAPVQVLPLEVEFGRLVITLLVATTLFITVSRTRRLLLRSIVDARRSANLQRFVPEQVGDALAADGAASATGRRQPVVVMFIDIQGFTTMTEDMPPEEVTTLLNDYRRRVGAPVVERDGTIDKFVGDAVMAVFGVPQSRDRDAANALAAARAVLDAIDGWNRERQAAGAPAVDVGIGAHYGDVVAGVLGGDGRLEYTVIGDTVNTAERIERLTRATPTRLVVSSALLKAAGALPAGQDWQPLPPQSVRGRRQQVKCYAYRPKVSRLIGRSFAAR